MRVNDHLLKSNSIDNEHLEHKSQVRRRRLSLPPYSEGLGIQALATLLTEKQKRVT